MPFLYDPTSCTPTSPSFSSSPSQHSKMSFNFLRRKSNRTSDNAADRSAARTESLSHSGGGQDKDTSKVGSRQRRSFYLPSRSNPVTDTDRLGGSTLNSSPAYVGPPSYTGPAQSSFSASAGPHGPLTNSRPTSDAPPSYTASSIDDPYAFLAKFDTIFLIDDSASMTLNSRWNEAASALAAIAPICTKYDSNGIDIYFLNTPDSPSYQNVTSATRVTSIFNRVRPAGGTPIGSRLNNVLKPYYAKLEQKGKGRSEEVKPLNIICLTDGEATDDPESSIMRAARKLDQMDAVPWQLGIQFFQVGNDPAATKALQELDDGLMAMGCTRDIVDTVPWKESLNADGLLKVVLGSVNRRLDRKNV